jgi:hypothetical protein
MARLDKSLSAFIVTSLFVLLFMAVLTGVTAYPQKYPMSEQIIEDFVTRTIHQWRSVHGTGQGIKIARIDVRFTAAPDHFVKREGTVIVPVGLELPHGQHILAIAAYPPAVRELEIDGMRAVAWAYPGNCRMNLHFVGLCLVRQIFESGSQDMQECTFDRLPKPFLADSTATAAELEEHSLHECAAFKEWSAVIAGQGFPMERFRSILTTIAAGIIPEGQEDKEQWSEDICAAMRNMRFTPHKAHVLAVMASREIGLPCFGFVSAQEKDNYLVGTYSDQSGWLFFDLAAPEQGFFADPPVLLTKAPLIAEFEGCRHGCWYANAAAYQQSQWGGISAFSRTKWGIKNLQTDSTIACTWDE